MTFFQASLRSALVSCTRIASSLSLWTIHIAGSEAGTLQEVARKLGLGNRSLGKEEKERKIWNRVWKAASPRRKYLHQAEGKVNTVVRAKKKAMGR